MDKKIKNPEIRFKGFTEDWNLEKLEKLANFSKGRGYSKGDLIESGTPLILYGRLYTKYQTIINAVDTFTTPKDGSVYSNGNEVIVPASGETPEDIVIASAVLKKDILLGGDLNIIIPNDSLNSVFLALSISNGKVKKDLVKRAQGKSVVHIRNNDLKEAFINFPNITEQNTIISFFQNLDNLITLHQKKYDKLVILKKAMLVKMFPKKGALVPEIRFKGFTENWIDKKVSDLFQVTRGNVLAATETSFKPTKTMLYPVYSSQTKNDGLLGYYKDFLFENAITWTTDGANAGTVNYRPGKFYSTNVNGVLLSNEGYTNKSIAEIINLVAWKYVSHVGNPKLMNNVMSEIKIFIPNSIKEQNLISHFFDDIDNQIALHKKQLEKLNNIKKACFSKMFVAQE